MALSVRASNFLSRQERRPAITEREQIVAALERAQLPVFEPVIAFQENYGGLTLYAWLEPLVYGILHQESRRYPAAANTISAEQQDGVWHFECVDTLYQESFHIDQAGQYLEGWQPVATSIEKFFEGQALLDELGTEGKWEWIGPVVAGAAETAKAVARYHLVLVLEASDEYTTWWRSETWCLRSSNGVATAWHKEISGT